MDHAEMAGTEHKASRNGTTPSGSGGESLREPEAVRETCYYCIHIGFYDVY